MAKIDKTQYTKQEWREIRNQRRIQKVVEKNKKLVETSHRKNKKTAFVLGNGTSRATIDPADLWPYGKTYGCNALYRSFAPDFLVAVDVKMILEINKSKYQHTHSVWTNPNKSYSHIKHLNFFSPSKGWSSGPTALWLASQHGYETIYILGFDYKGLKDNTSFNNIYASTMNYKKSTDGPTFYGNWMRQTRSVIQENKDINYVRIIASDNYSPDELNTFDNYNEVLVEDFTKMFEIS
jgi:hypothetical protein